MSPVALLRSQLLQSLALQWFWRWRLIFYVFCCKTLTNHLIQSLGSRTKCWVICPAVVFASPVWVCRSMSPEILKLKIDENGWKSVERKFAPQNHFTKSTFCSNSSSKDFVHSAFICSASEWTVCQPTPPPHRFEHAVHSRHQLFQWVLCSHGEALLYFGDEFQNLQNSVSWCTFLV